MKMTEAHNKSTKTLTKIKTITDNMKIKPDSKYE